MPTYLIRNNETDEHHEEFCSWSELQELLKKNYVKDYYKDAMLIQLISFHIHSILVQHILPFMMVNIWLFLMNSTSEVDGCLAPSGTNPRLLL